MIVHAQILAIGNELLRGETVDSNAAFLAAELTNLGATVAAIDLLPDDRRILAHAFSRAVQEASLVVSTGGLGPTTDDVTREGLADALGEEAVIDSDLVRRLEAHLGTTELTAAQLTQATRIPSATPLPNDLGSAPGWWVEADQAIVVTLPGVPIELRRIWSEQVRPRLLRRFDLRSRPSATLKLSAIDEAAVAGKLASRFASPGHGTRMGVFARADGIHVHLEAGTPDALKAAIVMVEAEFGDMIWGRNGDDLRDLLIDALGRAGISTFVTREFGSAGALIALLADPPATLPVTRYLGGIVDFERHTPVAADAQLTLRLHPERVGGWSTIEVSLQVARQSLVSDVRTIHGSGMTRAQRAAFAAADLAWRAVRDRP